LELLAVKKIHIEEKVELTELSTQNKFATHTQKILLLEKNLEDIFANSTDHKNMINGKSESECKAIEERWTNYQNAFLKIKEQIKFIEAKDLENKKQIAKLNQKKNEIETNSASHKEAITPTEALKARENLLKAKQEKLKGLADKKVNISSKAQTA